MLAVTFYLRHLPTHSTFVSDGESSESGRFSRQSPGLFKLKVLVQKKIRCLMWHPGATPEEKQPIKMQTRKKRTEANL